MGCFCHQGNKHIKIKLNEENDTSLNKREISIRSNNSNKNISIKAKTFIKKKNFKQFIDDYNILEKIGNGAFGIVQKVLYKYTNEMRAMKIINRVELSHDKKAEENLLREIDILKKLDHPNILKLYECFFDEKKYYLVTEFCNGGDLFEKISSYGSFNEKLTALIMKNILMAVAYLHNQGYMHRDLKPENILLDKSEKLDNTVSLKLIDFGTAINIKEGEKLSERIGTAYYIAPEVLKQNYNEKCDVWSCGVILFILLAGEPPFFGENNEEIIENVELGYYNIDKYNHISDDAKNLVKLMMEYNPKKRISAQQALDHIWIKNQAPNSFTVNQSSAKILENLKSFKADLKLCEATIAFIVNQLTTKNEIEELRKIFMELDTNNDGKLSYEEIVNGYKKIYGSLNPEQDAKEIFEKVDADDNGFIGYEEFIRATVDKKLIFKNERLEHAFRLFDKNGDGKINAKDIKAVLGRDGKINSDAYNDMIKEVDINGDGEITIDEFKQMMMKTVKLV